MWNVDFCYFENILYAGTNAIHEHQFTMSFISNCFYLVRPFVVIEIYLRELIDLSACSTVGSRCFQFLKGRRPRDNIKFKACKSVINKIEKRCVRPPIEYLHHYSDVMMSAMASQITV